MDFISTVKTTIMYVTDRTHQNSTIIVNLEINIHKTL